MSGMPFSLRDFVTESNRIEGILRPPRSGEVAVHATLLRASALTVALLQDFVSVVQPGAMLRDLPGLNVTVGAHVPPPGGPAVRRALEDLLDQVKAFRFIVDPFEQDASFVTHHAYETLHPFTDGNGRSGRAVWLWQMGGIERCPLGFLHTWYYQSLNARRTDEPA